MYFRLALQLYFFPLISVRVPGAPQYGPSNSSTAKSCSLENTLISLLVTRLEGLIGFPLLRPSVSQPFLDQPVHEKVLIWPSAFPSFIVYSIFPWQSYIISPSACRNFIISRFPLGLLVVLEIVVVANVVCAKVVAFCVTF